MDGKISKVPVNILMVDDQPEKLLSYETILADMGENLIRAKSGKEALDQLLRKDIAVLLVDVCMPEMDGFELASMIRSHPRFQRTAIILVSSVMLEDAHRMKGYDAGAMDYVSVPIIPEILRAKVSVFTDLYRKTEALEKLNQELERRVAERTAQIEWSAVLLGASEQRLRLVVENVKDYSILMLDPEGLVNNWNTGAERVYGYRVEEIVGRPDSVFFPPDDVASGKPQRLLEVAQREGHSHDEGWRIRKDGSVFWAEVTITALHDPDGMLLGFSKVVHDLSERKRAEVERTQLLKRAERARREAEEANQMKDEFLAVLSHELRTPLNAITGWAHMLKAGGLDPETQAKAVDAINRNSLLQARLISDLLDVSRIVSGKLRLELKPLDMPSVVRAAIETVKPTAQAKEIQIHVALSGGPANVRGDATRLQQVVWNLLSNAAKFTPRKGNIHVSLNQVNAHVELTVEDDGPGIRADFLPHIFEPFRQADASSTRAHQGLGLGLAIVHNLTHLHGGAVHAGNCEGHSGAYFKVVLPVHAAPAEDSERRTDPGKMEEVDWLNSGAALKNARILVVDDELDAREVVTLILERCGVTVFTAASAAEAFEILQRERPDVLVADIEMPVEDGYGLIRRIKMLPGGSGDRIGCIALTAHAGAHDHSRLMSAGFHRHVPKPLQPRELIAAITALLQLRQDKAETTVPTLTLVSNPSSSPDTSRKDP